MLVQKFFITFLKKKVWFASEYWQNVKELSDFYRLQFTQKQYYNSYRNETLFGYKYISFSCDRFNKCFCTQSLLLSMAFGDMNSIYDKNDNLCKENHRPVNLLIMFSKVFERILGDQLTVYYEN